MTKSIMIDEKLNDVARVFIGREAYFEVLKEETIHHVRPEGTILTSDGLVGGAHF